ncbi:hypothetical protein DEJ46_17335 [Streptomyces venezuelae]|uniref:Uncharacterized protein n=1 Tax=Streptomyces venezuelae TaxID=54571 RepID=A0A5P2AQX5_STRVZ|nr:hypothetical protein DEJ46_17335 [Streptomyces venezuelae]
MFAAVAGTLGSAVAGAAVQRFADGTVDTGESFLRRIFRRGDGTGPAAALGVDDETERRANEELARLDEDELRRLAEALTAWLADAEGDAPAPERLVELVRATTPAPPAAPSTTQVTAHGDYSVAVQTIGDNATFNLGGSGDDRPRRRS